MSEQAVVKDHMGQHPCPVPAISRKGGSEGALWACACGKVYVCRHWWNYAGEGWEWKPTSLRVDDGQPT